MKQIITCLFLLFTLAISAQQTPNQNLNLSFDKTDTDGKITGCNYFWGKDSYYTYKDDSVKIDGPNSIRIQNLTGETDGKFAPVTFSLPANFNAKQITLKGYIKTENVDNGYAGLWLRSDAGDNVFDFGNLGEDAPTGSTNWSSYSVIIKMDKSVTKIAFGGLLAGSGKAWFDKFELYADELPVDKVVWQENVKTEEQLVKSNVNLDSLLTKQQVENLFALSKVWGFLKYHHPEVAKGKENFDKDLFKVMPSIANATDNNKRDELLLNWINSLGDENKSGIADQPSETNVHIKPNLGWISNKKLFSEVLINKLNNIYRHRNKDKNAYIKLMPNVGNPDFGGEEKYTGMTADDDGLRMLALFRYWNIIEYYFPSKYLIKENWDAVLKEFIPQFAANKTTIGYKLTCLKLINRIHDTHGNIYGDKDLNRYFGEKYSNIKAKIIDGKLIAVSLLHDSLGGFEKIKPGDEILSINNKTIAAWRAEREPLLCASNPTAADRNFAAGLLRGNGDELNIGFVHHGKKENLALKLYPPAVIYKSANNMQKPMFRFLNDSIGYITLANIKSDSLKKIFKNFAATKGIVIDIRNYPSEFMPFAMAQYLKPAPSQFVKFTQGNINNPGLFNFTPSLSNGLSSTDYYKGKIVILIDDRTQSQAEYTTMALQTAPGSVVMGSQTAGADGNVSTVPFPGGFGSYISGIGVFYPDGKETQGIGIVPDIELKQTRQGIKKGIDELLEKAIQYIAGNK